MIVFVPNLVEEKQDSYLDCLEKYIDSVKNDLHEKASKTLHVVYFQENEKIDRVKEKVTKSGDDLVPIAKYKKIVFELFDDYKFNFGRQIQDFIDSIAKILIAGCACGDICSSNGMTCELHDIISRIKDSSWTSQKEIRRTIEHYESLVCEGDNSILKTIKAKSLNDYEEALNKAICDSTDYEDNIPCDFTKVVDGKVTETRSKCIALLYSMEKAGKSDVTNKTLLDLLKKIGTQNGGLFMSPLEENELQSLHFDQLKTALSDSEELKSVYTKFNVDDRFIQNLLSFTDAMLTELPAKNVEELYSFMNNSFDNHWIGTYSDKMRWNCPKAEVLMKLLYLTKYISKMNAIQLRESMISSLKGRHAELNTTRATLATTIDEILGLMYSQKPQRDNDSQPFYGYLQKLTDVNELFTLCQRVLDEETDSMAVLCIVSSVNSRLNDIINSVKILSTQATSIKNSLSSLKLSIDKTYQIPIDTIYQSTLAAKLINLKSPEASKNTFKGYDNNYCWAYTRNSLKYNKDEAKAVFNAKLNPMKQDTLKQSDVSAFTTYLSRLLQTTTDIKAKLDCAMGLCNECKAMAEEYNELKSQISNLLKFEDNNG